jgi:hypothetical protein
MNLHQIVEIIVTLANSRTGELIEMPIVLQPGGRGVDLSGAKPQLLPQRQLAPADDNRFGFFVQNQDQFDIQVVLYHTPTASEDYTVIVLDGNATNKQGASYNMATFRHTGPIGICAAEGAQFAATDYR